MHAPDATDSLLVSSSWHEMQPLRGDVIVLSRLIDMQELPKPKPASQPVPRLTRAPARPQFPVTEPAQEVETADTSETEPSKRAAGKKPKGTPKPVALNPATEPKPAVPATVQDAGPTVDTSEGVPSKRAAGNTSKGAPKPVAIKPAAEPKPSVPATVQDAGSTVDASEAPAISQDSAEAVRESTKPKQAAPVVPETMPEAVPAPQRPTRPRPRPSQPIEGAAPLISTQEDAAISPEDDASSAVAAEDSQRASSAVSTAETPADALIEATNSVAELEDPSQADISRAAGDAASAPDVLEGSAADVSTFTKTQDNGAGVALQPAPAPPVALPKPSLRTPQPAKAFTVRAILSPRLLCMLARSVSCRCTSTRMLPVHAILTE